MTEKRRANLACYVAGHALMDARLGVVFDMVSLMSDTHWTGPARPLTWRTAEQAQELMKRFSAGYIALERKQGQQVALDMAASELQKVADILEKVQGTRPTLDNVVQHATSLLAPFFEDAANRQALRLIEGELLRCNALDMHEIDFLIESADGDPDALEDLERYRATFSKTPIPWPDDT